MNDSLRLIIHASDPASLERARSNAANLLACAPDAQMEIVVNAGAVAAALAATHPTDAYLRLCGNTLRKQQLDAPADIVIVPAAVLHIAERQRDGWGYMRA